MAALTFVDTHAHYNMPAFADDLDEALAAARAAGVEKIVCPAVSFASNEQMLDALADKPGVYFALGIHPKLACPRRAARAKLKEMATMKQLTEWHYLWIEVLRELHSEIVSLISLVESSECVVAIGEAGLDYSLGPSEPERQIQIALFRQQVHLALSSRLPLVLHVRDAREDAVAVLEDYCGAVTGVVHCFTGGPREADEYLRLGLYLGIGGRVTHDERADCVGLREVVASMPADRLLLETDAPYVLPKGFGSRRNDSTAIPQIAAEVARLRGMDVAEVARVTTANAERLFFSGHGERA